MHDKDGCDKLGNEYYEIWVQMTKFYVLMNLLTCKLITFFGFICRDQEKNDVDTW